MKTLALELSTDSGSLAWVENGAVLMKREWLAGTRQRRPVFADLHQWIQAEASPWSQIDRLAVGIGPGAFSGLRLGVSLIRGLALPDGRPVTAVSSARALARSVMQETGSSRVVVLGDARRNEVWAGCFEREDGIVRLQGDWVVGPAETLAEGLKTPGTVWVTSDWDRLGVILDAQCPVSVRLIPESRSPSAVMVAGMVDDLADRGLAGEPLVPIYVHPAVSIAPRY
ncbi:MAG: tRNA (adenosine(37)-N6)-threonylcarbamoyltransferase complex dimerization subunit type 1 TsaB [bacterium]